MENTFLCKCINFEEQNREARMLFNILPPFWATLVCSASINAWADEPIIICAKSTLKVFTSVCPSVSVASRYCLVGRCAKMTLRLPPPTAPLCCRIFSAWSPLRKGRDKFVRAQPIAVKQLEPSNFSKTALSSEELHHFFVPFVNLAARRPTRIDHAAIPRRGRAD